MKSSPLGLSTPGARSKDLQQLRDQYVARGVSQAFPIYAERAEGSVIVDVDGREYLDFTGGIAVENVGHCHPEVVEAVKRQAETLIHTCFQTIGYEPYIQLAAKLAQITPGDFPKKSVLLNSGAEAVENAVKVARRATGRQAVIAFENAFHGRTLLTMTLTGKSSPYKHGFGPFAPEVYRAAAPYCYRCPFHATYPTCGMACLESVRELMKVEVPADEVAAILVEPIQGEGGYIVPPDDYLPGLQQVANESGVLFIADEIQSGFGRTGRLFASEHWGLTPDIMVMAKSMGAGMPISAVTGKAEMMDATQVGGLGGTYGGNPVACAAALAVLDLIEEGTVLEQARQQGELLMDGLLALQEKYPAIGDVRGKGPMIAIELVKDRTTKEPDADLTGRVVQEALNRGLLLLKAGTWNNVIRLMAPLTTSADQIDQGLATMDEALAPAGA